MRVGVVVDSTCDLPESWFTDHDIRILPISIRLGDELLVDERNAAETRRFFAEKLSSKGADAESVPYSTDQIRAVFLERLVIDYDLVFCITVSGKHSPIFDNATGAAFGILKEYRPVRAAAEIPGPFSMRVIDSKTLFAGTAVLVAEAASLIAQDTHPNQIRLRLDELTPQICGYMVPADLAYVRDRGFKKGIRKSLADSIRGLGLTVGSALSMHPVIRVHNGEENPAQVNRSYEKSVRRMLEHITRRILDGKVASSHICLSYAGDVRQVPGMDGYAELEQAARKYGIGLQLATMSATGAVNVGPGCLFVAYAGEVASM